MKRATATAVVILTLALKTGPRTYDLHLHTLATDERVHASDRARVVQQRIELFASHLEQHCLRAPLQWFNFYDFWSGSNDERSQREPNS